MAGTETTDCGNDGLRPGGLHPSYENPNVGWVERSETHQSPYRHRRPRYAPRRQRGRHRNDGLRPGGLHPSYEDKPKRRMGGAQRNPSIPIPAQTTALRMSPPAWPAPKRWVTAGRPSPILRRHTHNVGWVQRSETHQLQNRHGRPRYVTSPPACDRHRNDALRR
jgi:hypothetical protein